MEFPPFRGAYLSLYLMIRKIIDLEQLAPARLASRVKFYKGVQWGDGGAVKGLGLSSWDKRLRARSKGV